MSSKLWISLTALHSQRKFEISRRLEVIPMPSFPISHNDKVRGIDVRANLATYMTEQLIVSTTDMKLASLEHLFEKTGGDEQGGWLADDAKAYRQIPAAAHRRYSMVTS